MDISTHSNLSTSPSSILAPIYNEVEMSKKGTASIEVSSASQNGIMTKRQKLPELSGGSNVKTCKEDITLTLEEFVNEIPHVLRSESFQKSCKEERGESKCIVGNLFRKLNFEQGDLNKFSFIEPTKKYTRNLIATDNETFTLLLLCWNPGKFSPIHDHPCDGCWMRVCEGEVREVRYEKDETMDALQCISDSVMTEGENTYIHDCMGYHKIGNPCDTISVSLHLYCPPFQRCKIWMDAESASNCSVARMCNYSEYGRPISSHNE